MAERGTVSGAHLNPAVTLAFAIRGNRAGASAAQGSLGGDDPAAL
ncbi:hypothetical protein Afe04nite_71340 [Asanoa ferruginea]|nr:aquaporin [Asanoa ferruginea]GIF52595.1 hypothetical protein Afe04nite_71340 [Asanoa ferruginea]